MSNKLLEKLYDEASPKIAEIGYDLVDVEFVKEGANWYLRFFIDKLPKVELDDCAKVSEMLSDWLDETDPISKAYFLEVSSPGIERVLKKDQDFIRFAGSDVIVKLFSPYQGKKTFEGILGEVNPEFLNILDKQAQQITIPREQISRVNLLWKPGKEERSR